MTETRADQDLFMPWKDAVFLRKMEERVGFGNMGEIIRIIREATTEQVEVGIQ